MTTGTTLFCAVCLRTLGDYPELPNHAATMISGLAVCRQHVRDVSSHTLDVAADRVAMRKRMHNATAPAKEKDQ
jgi:hypothetical protein